MSKTIASQANLFSVNEEKIYSEMNDLNKLETFVNNNEGITGSVILSSPTLLNMFPEISLTSSTEAVPGLVWGVITGFVGGCLGSTVCCALYVISPVGILIAYLTNKDDSKQVVNALLGSLGGTVVGVGAGLLTMFLISYFGV